MRTYVSPIGYDTRRVTRPVVSRGLGPDDTVLMLRPATDSDTGRANRAIADVEQLLQEIEPAATHEVERVATDEFEETVRECAKILESIPDEHELIVSLGGGARDILLPLTVASSALAQAIDQVLIFSDIEQEVRPASVPPLSAHVPERARATFSHVVGNDGWQSLSSIADSTNQSKSTVIRHVNDLEDAGAVESTSKGKAKQVRTSLTGTLLAKARPQSS